MKNYLLKGLLLANLLFAFFPCIQGQEKDIRNSHPKSNPNKATVNFVVLMDWGDGSGYQLLLDADHNTFDRIFNHAGFIESDENGKVDYSEFEVKIPSNADGSPETSHIVIAPDTISVEVDPGIYDYIVTNPTSGDKIYMPGGPGSYANDLQLSAGSSYTIIIQEVHGSENCTLQIEASIDLALTELIVPESSETLGSEEMVKITVKNRGSQPINSFKAMYSVNDILATTETINVTLTAQEERSYIFSQKANLSATGLYEIKAWIEVENDAVSSNNSLSAKVDHQGPRQLPFICDFNQLEQWYQWEIIDNNKDNVSWSYYIGRDANDNISGFARIEYNRTDIKIPMDDYLILKNPVSMKSGPNNISFRYNAGGMEQPEKLRILYGLTSDFKKMDILDTLEFTEKEKWGYYSREIKMESDGDYFFALHACSGPYTSHINIDDFKLEAGTFKGTPDLDLSKIVHPVSGCGLDKILLGVVASNYGDADIKEFTLTCKLNGNKVLEETFNKNPLRKESTDTFYFSSLVNLEKTDTFYDIVIEGTVSPDPDSKTETNINNNISSSRIINYTPAELPFSSDFTDLGKAIEWHGDGWRYESDYERTYQAIGNLPLFSRCMSLETGREYNFRLEYKAGYEFIKLYTEDFDILYGIPGSPISEWKILKRFENCYTRKNYIFFDTAFSVEQAGDYSFAIICHSQSRSLYIKTTQISAILDIDVTLLDFTTPSIVPASHLHATTGIPVSVIVKNSGKGVVKQAKIVLSDKNGEKLGEKTFPLGPSGSQIKEELCISAPVKEGDTLKITAEVTAVDHENQDSNPDNILQRIILISDSTLAYDQVTKEMMGDNFFSVGSNNSYVTTGIPFHIQSRDTLTAASIAWHYTVGGDRVQISILPWNPQTKVAGKAIYRINSYAGDEQGWKNYDFPGIMIDSGWYMLTLNFPGTTLTADFSKNGIIYVMKTDSTFVVQEGMGYPGMRLIFGHNAKPLGKDISATNILHPNGDGFYRKEEEVVIRVSNLGFEKNKAKVHLYVNETAAGQTEVELAPYQVADVKIKADLSKPEYRYQLAAFVEAEHDMNPLNDTCRLTFNTYCEGDPYILDFELTNDFSTDYFNPKWESRDIDESATIGIQGFDFPGAGAEFAFMAFNPAQTNPSMINTGIPSTDSAFSPIQGNRYGAVFCASVGVNNDWLISPKLLLPKENPQLSFYAKSLTEAYGKERFNILVSNTDTQIENFVKLYSDSAKEGEWQRFVYDLSDFGGKNLHIAIQCVSRDALMFMIDNICISKPTANDFQPEDLPVQISVAPNPASNRIWIHSIATRIHRIQIFNTSGIMVYEKGQISQNNFSIGVSRWNPGIYFARIQTDQGCVVKKIVVK